MVVPRMLFIAHAHGIAWFSIRAEHDRAHAFRGCVRVSNRTPLRAQSGCFVRCTQTPYRVCSRLVSSAANQRGVAPIPVWIERMLDSGLPDGTVGHTVLSPICGDRTVGKPTTEPSWLRSYSARWRCCSV